MHGAECHGILIEDVKLQHTSQRCNHSDCGFIHEDSRDDDEFACLRCGKELYTNHNAARNIGWNLVQHWLTSGSGQADCQVDLNSTTVSRNDNLTPATFRGQTGSPLTSPPS